MNEARAFEEFSEEFIEYGIKESGLDQYIESGELLELFDDPEFQDTEYVYWAEPPFSFVTLTKQQNGLKYNVSEVELQYPKIPSQVASYIDFGLDEKHSYPDIVNLVKGISQLKIDEDLTDLEHCVVSYYLQRSESPYGKIYPLYKDQYIEDLSMSGPDSPVFVVHKEYGDMQTNIHFDEGECDVFVSELANRAGEVITDANPLVDATLVDGSRVQLAMGLEPNNTTSFTIRFFRKLDFTPTNLIKSGTYRGAI